MTSLLRRRWLAGIVFLAIIMLLTAGLGGMPMDADGASPGARLAGLVTCVLSPSPGPAPFVTPSRGMTETDQLDCDPTRTDRFRTAWIPAC